MFYLRFEKYIQKDRIEEGLDFGEVTFSNLSTLPLEKQEYSLCKEVSLCILIQMIVSLRL